MNNMKTWDQTCIVRECMTYRVNPCVPSHVQVEDRWVELIN